MDSCFCSKECAAARPCDLLARIKLDLLGGTISEETMGEILSGNWLTLEDFREQQDRIRMAKAEQENQERLDQLVDFQVSQEAVRKAQEKRAKARARRKP